MKQLIIILGLIGLLLAPRGIFAASETLTVEAGITPDSFFYFLDIWGDKLVELLTFSEESKVTLALDQAEERLAEAEVMTEEGLTELADQARNRYQERMEIAIQQAEQVREQVREQVMERVANAAVRHLTVLKERIENSPEEASGTLQKALEVSNQGLETSLRVISEEKRGNIIQQLDEIFPGLEEGIQKGAEQGKSNVDTVEEELDELLNRSQGQQD